MISAVASLPRKSHRDERPVLACAPLKPGFDRANLSRYADSSWDLGPAVFRENAPRSLAIVHFGSIEHFDIREQLRLFLYARLNVEPLGHRTRMAPTSLRQSFSYSRSFFDFVLSKRGSVNLRSVDQNLLDAYVKHLIQRRNLRPPMVAHFLEVVSDLYIYRDHLPSGGLTFQPWQGRSPSSVAGCRYVSENRTPRIPENIITPLLAWSLRYITDFAPDIFAARAELDQLENRRDALIAADCDLDDKQRCERQFKRLEAFLDRRRYEGRGVPFWTIHPHGLTTPAVNGSLLNLHIGIDLRAMFTILYHDRGRRLINAAVMELGTEIGGMDTPISLDPNSGQPWRPRFDTRTLAYEEKMLQAAAYVVCAYLTGMRDSEIQAMRRGCLSIARSEDGMIMRHRIRSIVYKGKAHQGEPAEWVTIAPVAKAIEALEQLSCKAASARGLNTLWPTLTSRKNSTGVISTEIVNLLNAYRTHLNAQFGARDNPAIPHGPNGQPWRITTPQFRRTIAWHIANRPFGTIAGMIQYKHVSVATFEGYSGSSASGFRAEVENQRGIGQLDDLMVYFDDRQAGKTLSGPAGPRIAGQLDAAAELAPLPAMIADRARLRTLLASTARTLHVGILADCFFDPGTALCLKHATGPEAKAPLTALCQPTRCPNACITARHRPVWARAAADAEALLKEKRLSEPQRIALRQDLVRFEEILEVSAPQKS